ncbi:MAG TPA: TlpA disulfide reductase family protein [Bacteroidia bacterium]|nr:TlpA disulfide reductase family protein [Bacteroidia bacterium]
MIKKFWWIAAFVVGLSLVLLFQYQKYRVAPKADLASLSCIDTSGKAVDLTQLKGRKTLLTFFATWCGDCLLEMKLLYEIKNTSLQDVDVIAISDEQMTKIRAFMQKKNYPFTFLKLQTAFANIHINTIPVTYLINTKGEVVYAKVGAINWKDPSVVSFTEETLK